MNTHTRSCTRTLPHSKWLSSFWFTPRRAAAAFTLGELDSQKHDGVWFNIFSARRPHHPVPSWASHLDDKMLTIRETHQVFHNIPILRWDGRCNRAFLTSSCRIKCGAKVRRMACDVVPITKWTALFFISAALSLLWTIKACSPNTNKHLNKN